MLQIRNLLDVFKALHHHDLRKTSRKYQEILLTSGLPETF